MYRLGRKYHTHVLFVDCAEETTELISKGSAVPTGYTVTIQGSTNNVAFTQSSALRINDGASGGYLITIARQTHVNLDMKLEELKFVPTGATGITITVTAENRRPFVFMVCGVFFFVYDLLEDFIY